MKIDSCLKVIQGDRGIRSSRPHNSIDTDLTKINALKRLYENFRNQLRSLSTPGKCKANNSYVERVKKNDCTLGSSFLKPLQLGMIRRKCPICGFYLRKMEYTFNIIAFQGCLNDCLMRGSMLWMRTKENSVAYRIENMQYPRESKRLQTSAKETGWPL